MNCEQCNQDFVPTRSISKFCSSQCQKLFHYHKNMKLKNLMVQNIKIKDVVFDEINSIGGVYKNKKDPTIQFTYCKIEDRTNYYRGNNVYGYGDNKSVVEEE